MNIAHDGPNEVCVTPQIGRVGGRESRIDVKAIAGKIVVFLSDVDPRVYRKDRSPQKGNAE